MITIISYPIGNFPLRLFVSPSQAIRPIRPFRAFSKTLWTKLSDFTKLVANQFTTLARVRHLKPWYFRIIVGKTYIYT